MTRLARAKGQAHVMNSAVVFIDYENARHYAPQEQAWRRSDLDPWQLARAVCGPGSGLDPVEVRVYLGVSNEPLGEADRKHYAKLSRRWKRNGPVSVQPLRTRNPDAQVQIVKELYTQLSIDLFKWATEVSNSSGVPEVAVLFSADRDCAPIVKRLKACSQSQRTHRIDLAAWLERSPRKPVRGGLLPVSGAKLKKHLLTWPEYMEAEA